MSRFSSLDPGVLLAILGHLGPKELCAMACVNSTMRALCWHNQLYAQHLERQFGLHLKGHNSAPPASTRALHRALAARLHGAALLPPHQSHVRFQALYTDGGVDENLYGAFWADRAFQANAWGAFCSKVSPNIHVLGLLKAHKTEDQATLHLRVVCAELCKWAAGRLLARVPLPALHAKLTPLQTRFFTKAAASLMRWYPEALFRLFCVLYHARSRGESQGQLLDMGVLMGDFSKGSLTRSALADALGAAHPAASPVALEVLAAARRHAQAHHPSSLVQRTLALFLPTPPTPPPSLWDFQPLLGRYNGPTAWVVGADGTVVPADASGGVAGGASAGNAASISGAGSVGDARHVQLHPCAALDALLTAVHAAVAPLAHLPPTWNAQPGALPATVPPRHAVEFDASSLHVFDTQQAERLASPRQLATTAAVLDMVSISRAGQFTCPVRTGAMLLGSITPCTPAPAAWLADAAGAGATLPPDPPPQPSIVVNTVAQQGPYPARELQEAMAEAEGGPAEASAKLDARLTRAYLQSVTGQASCRALDGMTSLDQVVAAVRAGRLPRIVQHRLLLNAEVVEFERVPVQPPRQQTPSEAQAGDAPAPIPLQPVMWFRFYTRSEVRTLFDVFRYFCQSNNAAPSAVSRARQHEPWGTVPPPVLERYRKRYTAAWRRNHRGQQQEQGGAGGPAAGPSSTLASSGPAAATSKQLQKHQRHQPVSDAHLAELMPRQLVCMGPGGQLEAVAVDDHVLVAPLPLGRAAWGMELLRSQDAFLNPRPTRRRSGSRRASEGEVASDQGIADGGWAALMSSDLMGTDSSDLEAQLDDMQEDAGPLNVPPAQDVHDLLDMMGYVPMEVDGGSGDDAASSSSDDSLGSAGAHADDINSHPMTGSDYDDDDDEEEGSSSSGSSSSYETMSSGEEAAVIDDDVWPLVPPPGDDTDEGDEDGGGWSGDEDDIADIAAAFPDLVDNNPAKPGEQQLIVLLSSVVGMEPLTQSHIELERECHVMIDEAMLKRTAASDAAAAAAEAAAMGRAAVDRPGEGSAARKAVDGAAGPSAERAGGGAGPSVPPPSKPERKTGRVEKGHEGRRRRRGKGAKHQGALDAGDLGADTDTEEAVQRGPLAPLPSIPVHFLPGDDTALDSVAFKALVSAADMRTQVGLLQLRLAQRRAGNLVCIKLITPEDRMEEMGDTHEDPNVDLQFVATRGAAFKLPPGLELAG